MTKIYITEDGERVEATGKALEQVLTFQAQFQAEREAAEAKAETDAIGKAALLERLGITADEAKLLLN